MSTKEIIKALHDIMDECDIHAMDDYQFPLISSQIIDQIHKSNNRPVIIDITSNDCWRSFTLYNWGDILNLQLRSRYTINNHPILLIFSK